MRLVFVCIYDNIILAFTVVLFIKKVTNRKHSPEKGNTLLTVSTRQGNKMFHYQLQTIRLLQAYGKNESGFYPGLHIRGCKQEPGCHTGIYTWLTHLLTYLLTYLLECCCVVYLVHIKFDLCILSNRSRQNSLLVISDKWVSVKVDMFAVYYSSHIHHSHWHHV